MMEPVLLGMAFAEPEFLLSIPSPLQSPHVLSTQELFATLDRLAPRVAVFDCDGTLWSGDAGSSFMWWSMESGLIAPAMVAWLNERYDGYRRGEVSEVTICGDMVAVYAGLPEAALRQAAATFFRETIEPHIFPELHELVHLLQSRGTEIWAVSSTNQWVIEEGVRRFNIPAERVLAAQVAVENATVTDRLLAVPTDEGKVAALQQAGVSTPDAVFGNSVHDAAMLAIARQPFPINPTSALIERSAREGWSVYLPLGPTPRPSDQHV